ncbi:MAG: NUDIX domain-containing protein [Deltaproteobacteria bacterium]|nr:NUDIX domain-containing protein [Deltaproteobacteria bacterium]
MVARADGGAVRYLLVRARRNPTWWIFPKGHIEVGETWEDAALRETAEEAGVEALPGAFLGVLDVAGQRVAYYLLRPLGELPSAERERRWCDYDEAASLLALPALRAVLARAHTRGT